MMMLMTVHQKAVYTTAVYKKAVYTNAVHLKGVDFMMNNKG